MPIKRQLQTAIELALKRTPAVVLLGPRQVGKTTLARVIAAKRGAKAVYLDLERPSDRAKLGDADGYLRSLGGRLAVIDEIHRVPELFATLRGIIDDRRAARDRFGHFLLLGSASLELMNQASESLAGRIAYVELTPIHLIEFSKRANDADRLWLRGGFPDSLVARSDSRSFEWRMSFIRSYLERDVPMFAPRLPAETVGRLWTMLAHAQATPLNQSRLASSLAVSVPAVSRYVDLLVDLLLVRRLRPWSGSIGKRLVRTPKTYVRDSGIVHALLGLESLDDILGHPVAGASWEGFVIENLLSVARDQYTPYYYRTEDGAEVDLVLERGGRVELAIEIKRSTAPTLSKGFHSALAVLKPRQACVVHGGRETWTLGSGVIATSLSDLMRRLGQGLR